MARTHAPSRYLDQSDKRAAEPRPRVRDTYHRSRSRSYEPDKLSVRDRSRHTSWSRGQASPYTRDSRHSRSRTRGSIISSRRERSRAPSKTRTRGSHRTRSRERTTCQRRSRSSHRRRSSYSRTPSRRITDESHITNRGLEQLLDVFKSIGRTDNLDKLNYMNNTVPEFDPARKEQTMSMWLHKVNECSTIYGWSEKQTIHFSLPKLRGVSQRWYEGLSSVLFTWEEWQRKLLAAFPSTENYGQMLSDMLAKRARFGDSLENYYYDKIALLNRCGITGSRAVECILHGIDDRSVRLGAEAVQFDDPDKLLSYLRNARNIKIQNDRRPPRSQFNAKSREILPKQGTKGLRCFNCKQEGHTSYNCPDPVKRCDKCKKIGHETEQCFSTLPSSTTKTVMRVFDSDQSGRKYFKTLEIDGIPFDAFIDFGSECCMIRETDFNQLHSTFDTVELPSLKGFGNSIVKVIGRKRVLIQIDEIQAYVDLFIVPDSAMHVAVIIGQSLTEQSHIVVHKTSDELKLFQHSNDVKMNDKVELYTKYDSNVSHVSILDIYTDPIITGDIYVEGGLRRIGDVEYSIFSGLFSVENGICHIIASIPTDKTIMLNKNSLVARGRLAEESLDSLLPKVMRVTRESYQPIDSGQVKTGNNISFEEKSKLLKLLNDYRDCFASDLAELGCTSVGEMRINLHDDEPVVYRPYRLAFKEKEIVRNIVSELIQNGIVQPSTSPYASPVVLVRKKNGEFRLCIDFRALNKKTIKENYPIPLIDDQLDVLAGHQFYTTLDLASGYYQVPIRECDRHKTAFVTPDGHFEFTRMPFGLANAPATFQRIMNQVLGSSRYREALAYLDDIIVPAKNLSEGMNRLENVLKLFRNAGLTLKLSKCLFFGDNVNYLGFEISKDGIQPGTHKIEAVAHFPVPQNQHNVRQFLGLASFFRRFVQGFSIIAKPLTHLLKKNVAWVWGPEQESAFRTLQDKLIRKPTLALYDPSAETELHTDACKAGVAGILLQRNKTGLLAPIAYFSKQTTPEEQNYSSYDLETLAVVSALRKFRVYLVGLNFKIITDCNSLRATFEKRDMIPRVARWWQEMQEYTFNIEYRPGTSMVHVDALSRNPIPTCPSDTFHVRNVTEENWLVTVQDADSEIQRIVQILKDPKLHDVIDIRNNFKLKGNKLFRITSDGERWVVPKGVRWQILKSNHDDIGHFSVDKTFEKVKASFWFPRMRNFIKKYVSSCLECTYSKSSGGKQPGYLHPIEKVDIPFDTVHVDHVGPFVRSKRGNIYILVLIDAYTRYIYLKSVRNTKSNTTIKAVNEYFGIFGVPRRLISDRGTSFTSTLFKKFVSDKGIKHVLNAVSTPRANGQVERYNRVIINALTTKSVGTAENSWDDHLPDVQWGMNNTFNKGINRTPAEALFGLRPVGRNEGRIMSELRDMDENLVNLETNRTEMRKQINAHIETNQEKQKKAYDMHRCQPPQYNVGDLVRIERQVPATGQSKKLIPKYQGPYRITSVLDHDRFVLEDTPLTKKNRRQFSTIAPVDKIKPWLNFQRPHADDVELSDQSDDDIAQI